ncbi:hypothetical protein BH24ACI3_BH24ACI3_17520 [soil metagenome]
MQKAVYGVLVVIGLIGVLGQAALLHNDLVHSYPFKMMSLPPSTFYSTVGEIGYYVAILTAIIAIVATIWLPRFLTSALPVVVCPLAYWVVFEASHLIQGFSREEMSFNDNFDSYTGNLARYEFGFEVLTLLVFGGVIGLAIGFLGNWLSRKISKKLA